MKIASVILAAGEGKRMGEREHKPYLTVRGRPIIAYTVDVFDSITCIGEMVLVVHSEREAYCQEFFAHTSCVAHPMRIVRGGERRQDSVYNGLQELAADTDIVVIHDGVRPCVGREMVEAVIEATISYDAVVPGVKIGDTIKEVSAGGEVITTIEREHIWCIQTPQGFKYELIKAGYELCRRRGISITDDAMAVEAYGHKVKVIEGDRDNIKLTTKSDMVFAEAILESRIRRR